MQYNNIIPSEFSRITPHKQIFHYILNKVLIARVLYRCDLAHRDRFLGFEVGERSLFLTSLRGILTSGGGNFVSLVLVHAHVHVDDGDQRIFTISTPVNRHFEQAMRKCQNNTLHYGPSLYQLLAKVTLSH